MFLFRTQTISSGNDAMNFAVQSQPIDWLVGRSDPHKDSTTTLAVPLAAAEAALKRKRGCHYGVGEGYR